MGAQLGSGVGGIELANEQGTGSGGGASGSLIAPAIDIEATADAVTITADNVGIGKGITLTADSGGGSANNARLLLGAANGAGTTRATLSGEHVRLAGASEIQLLSGTALITLINNGIVIDATGIGPAGVDGELDLLASTLLNIVCLDNIAIIAGSGAAGDLSMSATDGSVNLGNTGAHDVSIGSGQDLLLNPTRDETHTIGRNFSVTAAGSSGIQLSCTHASAGNFTVETANGDLSIRALAGDGLLSVSDDLRISGGTIALFAAGGIDGTSSIADVTGGTVQDSECRTALNTLLAVCRAFGMLD